MKIFNRNLQIRLIWIVIIVAILIALVLGSMYWNVNADSKLASIYSGLFTGLVIAIVQLFLSWYEFKEIEKFKSMGVIDIRADRDDRDFYERIIKQAKRNISLMGVTASRFIDDFADLNSDRESSKVLLAAMDKGVDIKILIPEAKYLAEPKQQTDASHVAKTFRKIKSKYPNRFEVKYFDHVPTHSIFFFDDQCILGPVFPEISSKDTPAIQLYTSSRYVQKYLDYFEKEWKQAQPLS